MTVIKIKPIHPKMGKEIPLPKMMHPGSAGFDLHAAIDKSIILPGFKSILDKYADVMFERISKKIADSLIHSGYKEDSFDNEMADLFCPVKIPCGFAASFPDNYEIQIRPRSGLASRGVMVVNSPGTIDSSFRGEWQILLTNKGFYDIEIRPGDRVAQMVMASVMVPEIEMVEELDATERGTGGFGSSGR